MAVVLLAWPARPAADEPRLAIVGATVVNPLGYPSLDDATLLIEGDTITAVGNRAEVDVPEHARVIDARGQWVIPGLMDLHVHFGQSGTLHGAYQGNKPDVFADANTVAPGLGLTAPQLAVERVFRQFARAGVTTVRSLGEYGWAYSGQQALRPRAERDPLAPRLVLSTVAYFPRTSDPSARRITSPQQGVRLLRRFAVDNDVDLLKIWWVDGRFVGEPDATDEWKQHVPIVEAMLAEAKQLGMGNGIDAIEAAKAKEVARLGGNLVHGIFFGQVDPECLDLMKANKTQITSTLLASMRYFGTVAGQVRYSTPELLLGDPRVVAQTLDMRGLDTDEFVVPRGGSRFDGMTLTEAMRALPYTEEIVVAVENLRRIHQAGLPVGIGTDAGIPGVLFGASIFAELALHVDAGMTAHEVLTAATINNARIVGLDHEIGSITTGKKADLVLVASDPRLDICHVAAQTGVVRRGRYFAAEELNEDTPGDIVTRLRNAFNCNDHQAMSKLLTPDIQLSEGPGGVVLRGRADVLGRFALGADGRVHRAVVAAATNGDTVIQSERWPDGRVYIVEYVVADQRVSQIKIVSVADEKRDQELP